MPSYLLISTDLAGAEWHVTSHLADEPRRIELHRTKGDAHSTTASLMSGLPIELIQREDALFGKETDPTRLKHRRTEELPDLFKAKWLPELMTLRQGGKKADFGLDYGMQYKRYALENLISEREAKIVYNLYHQIYPGLSRRFYPSIQQELKGGETCRDCGTFRYAYTRDSNIWAPGDQRNPPSRPSACLICGGAATRPHPARTLSNCFGRRVRLLGGWGPDLYQQGYSFKSQSTVADSVLQGMCDLAESPKPWHQKAEVPWQTTHDDLTIQYPIEPDLTDMAQCILDISQHFLRPVLRYPPHEFQLDTDTKIGFKYGDPTRERPYAGLIKLAYKEPTLEAMTEALRETIDKLRSQT